jgi:hypothetical protein
MHRLVSKDLEQGVGRCSECGPVVLHFRQQNGKRVARCPVGTARSNNSKVEAHGLTRDEARALKEGKSCRLCGHTKHLVVDHCHVTGIVRDVLCQWCNKGLGFFRDNPKLLREAAFYVELHKEETPGTVVPGAPLVAA